MKGIVQRKIPRCPADIKDGFCVFDAGLGDVVFLLDEDFVVECLLVFPELGRGS